MYLTVCVPIYKQEIAVNVAVGRTCSCNCKY